MHMHTFANAEACGDLAPPLAHTQSLPGTNKQTDTHTERHKGKEASMIKLVYLRGKAGLAVREQRQIGGKYI